MKLQGRFRITGFCLGLALLVLLVAGCQQGAREAAGLPDVPLVWLDQPLDGDQRPLAEAVRVQAHARDAAGPGIVQVRLYIDDQLVSSTPTDSAVPLVDAVLTWTPSAPGDYLVEVRAVNRAGAVSQPAVARLTVAGELKGEEQAAQPLEISFTADQTTVKYGDCTTLHWSVSNAESIQLDGAGVPERGSRQVCPTEPTNIYRLTATSPMGEIGEQVVSIGLPPTPKPAPGVEIAFEADQTTIAYGACTKLHWAVAHAQAITLDGSSVASQGSRQVCPKQPSNTYRLTVISLEGETIERVIIITVPATPTPIPPTDTPIPPTDTPIPPTDTPIRPSDTPIRPSDTPIRPSDTPQPAQISFWADDTSIYSGECTHLRWHIENVQAAFLNGAGVTGPDGFQQVCPSSTSTYVLSVNLIGGGSDTHSVTIDVDIPQSQIPSSPTNIQLSYVGGQESLRMAEISWNGSSAATEYTIQTYTCESGSWVRRSQRVTGTEISLRDDGSCSGSRPMDAGDGVRACSGAGCSASAPIPW